MKKLIWAAGFVYAKSQGRDNYEAWQWAESVADGYTDEKRRLAEAAADRWRS